MRKCPVLTCGVITAIKEINNVLNLIIRKKRGTSLAESPLIAELIVLYVIETHRHPGQISCNSSRRKWLIDCHVTAKGVLHSNFFEAKRLCALSYRISENESKLLVYSTSTVCNSSSQKRLGCSR